LGDGQAAYHGGYLLLLGGGVQLLDVGARAVAGDLLGDLEMAISEGRDLGQVGDAQYLVAAGQPPELLAHHATAAPTDAHVHLIEYQGGGEVSLGEDGLEGEHEAGGL